MIELVLTLSCLLFVTTSILWWKLSRARRLPCCLLFILVTSVTYFLLGSPRLEIAYLKKQKQPHVTKLDIKRMGGATQVVKQFNTFVQAHPNDPKAWILLAHIYREKNQLTAASQAYAKAYSLDNNNLTLMMEYAQTRFLAHGQKLDSVTQQLLDRIEKNQANNPLVLNILGTNAYFSKDYERAVRYWEQLLAQFPADSDEAKTILQAIAKAQNVPSSRKNIESPVRYPFQKHAN